jgi:hypothetical protein
VSRNKAIPFLFAFLLIAGLRGTCYVAVLTQEAEHACCVTTVVDQDMANSACCDDFAPSRADTQLAPIAVVIETVTHRALLSTRVATAEWPETIRPPPDRAPATRPVAPRAPPLS